MAKRRAEAAMAARGKESVAASGAGKRAASAKRAGPAGATPDKRREKGEASAQRIINAAIDLIAAEGLGKATMQRIAAQVGGTSALVVFHFRNMENLHTAVLEHLGALYEAMWQEHVHAPGLTAAQRLSGALACAQSFMQRHPKGVSVLIAFSSDLKSTELYRRITLPSDRTYLATGRQLVEEIAQEGGYRDIDLDVVSESVNYLIFGSWLWDHVEPKASHAPMLRKCGQLLLEHVFPKHFPLTQR